MPLRKLCDILNQRVLNFKRLQIGHEEFRQLFTSLTRTHVEMNHVVVSAFEKLA
jgi:hypothetical protein